MKETDGIILAAKAFIWFAVISMVFVLALFSKEIFS